MGAGIGGLTAAFDLAARGIEVTVLERAATPGGKMREVAIGNAKIDAGPTVFTMRWVFEQLFASAGLSLADHVTLKAADVLARHAWSASARLDLHADLGQSTDAIGDFAGAAEARRFLEFSERARRIYKTLEGPFIQSSCASPQALVRAVGTRGLGDLWQITPFATLWRALGDHFHDPRLRQLFGRYATYCGSSPWLAPATLMLVAHVEREGVWLVEGGMHGFARTMARVATGLGVKFRYNSNVARIVVERSRVGGVVLADGERIDADAVIVNADPAAVAEGGFGAEAARALPRTAPAVRSLSAVTWAMTAKPSGDYPLHRHNVFFSGDYRAEFDDLFKHSRLPQSPTVYVCAQDRDGRSSAPAAEERLLCLVNAPPTGDRQPFDAPEIAACEAQMDELLRRCGLSLERRPERTALTTPTDFNRLFPATGGALYGPAAHGWTASFNRPQARSRIPGLYLAGGSTHPGPGVPMAALSGRLAVASLIADLSASMRQSQPTATPGGMSMR
ncbi:MAG: phytoene desaturase family protein [Nevskia sp.]